MSTNHIKIDTTLEQRYQAYCSQCDADGRFPLNIDYFERIVDVIHSSKNSKVYPHYFKAVPIDPDTGQPVTHLDVYWVLESWGVSHPIGHAIKKLLCAGGRGNNNKNVFQDIDEAIKSIERAKELLRTK